MRFLSTVSGGVRGAALGSFYAFVRGSTEEAVVYADFSGKVRLAQPVPLNDYGARNAYVDEIVDVAVQDSNGIVVRSFTDGAISENVEVVSLSFTGRDYKTDAPEEGEPVSLKKVFNTVKDSFGDVDFNTVDSEGETVTMQESFGTLLDTYYNFMAPKYGAVADGVADDTTAFSSVVDDCHNNGGGVIFVPSGRYRLTKKKRIPSDVVIIGVGSTTSVFVVDCGDDPCMEFLGALNNENNSICDVCFEQGDNQNGNMVIFSSRSRPYVRDCRFESENGYDSDYQVKVDDSEGFVYGDFTGCEFRILAKAAGCFDSRVSDSSSSILFRGCRFNIVGPMDYTPYAVIGSFRQLYCVFDTDGDPTDPEFPDESYVFGRTDDTLQKVSSIGLILTPVADMQPFTDAIITGDVVDGGQVLVHATHYVNPVLTGYILINSRVEDSTGISVSKYNESKFVNAGNKTVELDENLIQCNRGVYQNGVITMRVVGDGVTNAGSEVTGLFWPGESMERVLLGCKVYYLHAFKNSNSQTMSLKVREMPNADFVQDTFYGPWVYGDELPSTQIPPYICGMFMVKAKAAGKFGMFTIGVSGIIDDVDLTPYVLTRGMYT